ncbi:hypothetical protein LSAT2_001322 [Lamellibrachia satsuma]|nr:hypothetical protein LSAT2_001322 [Lamellibrachia satsuma]
MVKITFWILLIAVVCATCVLGCKKKKTQLGPDKDLELCQQLCKKFYSDCVAAANSCPITTEKGFADKIEACYRKRNDCFSSCRKAFPKEGDL